MKPKLNLKLKNSFNPFKTFGGSLLTLSEMVDGLKQPKANISYLYTIYETPSLKWNLKLGFVVSQKIERHNQAQRTSILYKILIHQKENKFPYSSSIDISK